jgi:hypothetical protein
LDNRGRALNTRRLVGARRNNNFDDAARPRLIVKRHEQFDVADAVHGGFAKRADLRAFDKQSVQ